MKKILFGTTALLAGAFAASANAAEPIKLSVGGQLIQWFGYVNQENENAVGAVAPIEYNNFANASDTEVHFKGSSTLDNGMKVSAVIEMEAERSVNGTVRNADQQYLVLSGGWGELSMGERFHVAHRIHNSAPQFGISFQDARSFLTDVTQTGTFTLAGEVGTSVNAVENRSSVKLDYVSPSWNGLAFGVGYTPNVGGARNIANEYAVAHDSVAAGLAFSNTFSGVAVGADVGYYQVQGADTGTAAAGSGGMVRGLQSGLKAGMAGFTVGGSWLSLWDHNATGVNSSVEGNVWDAGVSYETGPYGVSVTYLESALAGATQAVGVAQAQDEAKYWSVAGKYTAGPGVVFDLSAVSADYQGEEGTDSTDSNGFAVIGGVRLAF